jgi:uncharacterized protein
LEISVSLGSRILKDTIGAGFRHERGGLDNAVAQANQGGFDGLDIFDADSHYMPLEDDLIDYISKESKSKYRPPLDSAADPELLGWVGDKQAIKKRYESIHDSAAYGSDANPDAYSLYYAWSRRIRRPEFSRLRGSGEGSPEEAVERFTSRMQEIGIKRSLIYPSNVVLSLGTPRNKPFEVSIANAYVDYMLDHFIDKYPEMLSIVPVPAGSPDKAADLIDRVGSEKGIIGLSLSPVQPNLFGETTYDPIYEAAQRKNLTVTVHGAPHFGPPLAEFKNSLGIWALAFPWWIMKQIVSVIIDGVPERFPNLRWVWVEGGISWIPWIMDRLDTYYPPMYESAPLLQKMPSEYIKDMYFTTQPLEKPAGGNSVLERVFKAFDAENHLMYASDYPHFDFDVPVAVTGLPFLSQQAKKKIMSENALKIFNLQK